MIIRYCDICGEELTDRNKVLAHKDEHTRVRGETKDMYGTLKVDVLTAINGVWNKGDVCKYCIIECVKKSRRQAEGCSPSSTIKRRCF